MKETTREQAVHLGRKRKEMWKAKLKREFPGQKITVLFPEDPSDDLLSYEIMFFIARVEDLTWQPLAGDRCDVPPPPGRNVRRRKR